MRRIREKDKKIHIILLTAVDSFESAQRALNLGANGYLLKPVNRAEINRLVEKLTAERAAQRGGERDSLNRRLSRELRSLCAAGEGTADFDWDSSALAQGNDGLLDLFCHPGPQQTEEEISAEAERLVEFLDSLGVRTDGMWQELRRCTLSAAERLLYGVRRQEDYSRSRAIILKANAFALERCTDPSFSLEETAEFVGLSKNYFTRFYSRETGVGFWAYVTRLRIDKAKLLPETSSLPMAEICARVGYDDVSYFSHRFKSLEGMSPRKFRETRLSGR